MYPQQYRDLLDFLDSNPQYLHDIRVRLLIPELIALPEQFARLVNVVAELTSQFNAFVETTDRRMNALEDHAAETNRRLDTLEEHAVETNRRLNALEQHAAETNRRLNALEQHAVETNRRLNALEQHAAETNRRLNALESAVETLKSDVETLKSDVQTLKNDVATLKGSDTERRARENILNIAKDELNLTRGRILLARGRETAAQFLTAINTAEERGLITETEADNVLVADIIIRARRTGDRRYVHGVFEVSRTIRLGDIQRAHDRAATVAAATGEETIAAVIGETIRPQQRAQAEDMGVQALIPAMFGQEEPDGAAT